MPMENLLIWIDTGNRKGDPSKKRCADDEHASEEVHGKNATWVHGEYGNHVESGSEWEECEGVLRRGEEARRSEMRGGEAVE
jgi:hypothetical protein